MGFESDKPQMGSCVVAMIMISTQNKADNIKPRHTFLVAPAVTRSLNHYVLEQSAVDKWSAKVVAGLQVVTRSQNGLELRQT